MSEVNLGRVQGGGIFYSTASSATSITKSTLTPTGLAPIVGDSVVFPNGDLRKITAVSGDNITCGSVAANFKGDKGDTGTTSSIVKTAAEWESQNIVLGAGVFGYDSTNKITKVGDGTTGWNDLPYFLTSKPDLETMSWEDVISIAEEGTASQYFSIGEKKTLNLTDGTSQVLRIIGFDHDDISDGSGKAGITFETRSGLSRHAMSSSYYSGGWASQELRTTLNTTIFEKFPDVLKQGVKTVAKKYYSTNPDTLKIVNDKLFILSMAEFGIYSYGGGDGTMYAFYEDGTREKANANYLYWTRTLARNRTYDFYGINRQGDYGTYYTLDRDDFLAPFAFCI